MAELVTPDECDGGRWEYGGGPLGGELEAWTQQILLPPDACHHATNPLK